MTSAPDAVVESGQGARQARRARGLRRRRVRDSGRASTTVSVMKVLLPACVIGMLLVVLAWPQILKVEENYTIATVPVGSAEVSDLTMTNPRFIGVDANGQNFEMTAASAQQQSKDSPLVTLAAPKADIGLKSGDWLALSARKGVYDRISKTAKFAGTVTIYRDDGYIFETNALKVDLAAGTAASNQKVTASGPLGQASAEGIRLRKRGQHITLTGSAKIILAAPETAR